MVISETKQADRRTAALTAGVALILMALAAFFSFGYAHASLVVPGDASATWHNIQSSSALYRAEIADWVVILICDVVVAWALYVFLKPVHPALSLLGAWLRLLYTAILAVAVLNLVYAQLLAQSDIAALQPQTMLFLEAFDAIWSIGLIVFGGHLLLVGGLAFRSDLIPKFIGVLLFIAALGYILIHMSYSFFPAFDKFTAIMENVLMAPMTAGELGFGLWLLFRGGRASVKV